MNCACAGQGLGITLCDFHTRVFAARNNRLVMAAADVHRRLTEARVCTPEVIETLSAALVENGVGLQDTAGPQYVKKAHFLLRRAYDTLEWIETEIPFPKAGWDKRPSRTIALRELWAQRATPLLEELRKVFNPTT